MRTIRKWCKAYNRAWLNRHNGTKTGRLLLTLEYLLFGFFVWAVLLGAFAGVTLVLVVSHALLEILHFFTLIEWLAAFPG